MPIFAKLNSNERKIRTRLGIDEEAKRQPSGPATQTRPDCLTDCPERSDSALGGRATKDVGRYVGRGRGPNPSPPVASPG